MESLLIEKTEFTPEINLNTNGTFIISGISRPEDVSKFYEKPIDWLKKFKEIILLNASNKYKIPLISIIFKMKYFNSASAKHMLKMVEIISGYQVAGVDIKVEWYYDEADEQLYEDGQDLSDAIGLPFKFIAIK